MGALKAHPVDVDVAAATNADLEARIAEGSFLHDLYERFAGEVVTLPPLRARREEIPLLAQCLIAEKGSDRIPSREFILRALEYHWPGNVRELRNVVGRALRDAKTPELDGVHVPDAPLDEPERAPAVAAAPATATSLDDVERRAIENALAEHAQNQSRAAETLGIARSSLRSKMKKHGLKG